MFKQGKYENTVEVILTKRGTPILFKQKIDELMAQGAFDSKTEAEAWLESTPIVLCLVYHKYGGLYAVEDDALDSTVSPYDGKTPSENLNKDPGEERVVTTGELCARLSDIGEDARKAILSLMAKHKATSLNVGEYYRELDITNYSFFDVNQHGFGTVLSLEGIDLSNGGIDLVFIDENCDESVSKPWDELYSDEEKYYVLNMVEEIFDLVDDEESPAPIIPIGTTFEEIIE